MAEIILQLGAEGGSLLVQRKQGSDGASTFRLVRNESFLVDLLSEDDAAGLMPKSASQWVSSWTELLGLLDRYRGWPYLYRIHIADEFRAAFEGAADARRAAHRAEQ